MKAERTTSDATLDSAKRLTPWLIGVGVVWLVTGALLVGGAVYALVSELSSGLSLDDLGLYLFLFGTLVLGAPYVLQSVLVFQAWRAIRQLSHDSTRLSYVLSRLKYYWVLECGFGVIWIGYGMLKVITELVKKPGVLIWP